MEKETLAFVGKTTFCARRGRCEKGDDPLMGRAKGVRFEVPLDL